MGSSTLRFCRPVVWAVFALSLIHSAIAQTSPGNAVNLSGTDYIRTTLWSGDMFTAKSFTFELWFNANGPGVLINETDTVSASAWDYSFAEVTTNGLVRVGAPNISTINVGTVAFGTWHHLVVVCDNPGQKFSAYLDGALAGTSNGTRQAPADIGRSSVYCLGRGGPKNLGPGPFFTGKFDEVRIWNIPLTANDVAATWNRVRTNDASGLMALWHFDTSNTYLSPDARSGGNNPAWHVPENQNMPLVVSTVPLGGSSSTITTLSAVVTDNTAVLRGSGNPQGTNMNAYFEWGATTSYGSVTASQALGAGTFDIAYTIALTNLKAGTYHYRAVADVGTNTIRGNDISFIVAPPSVATLAAVASDAAAQLNGSANPHGFPLNAYFEYGSDTTYGNVTLTQALGSGSANLSVSATVTNIKAGTYHYRIVGSYADGTILGADQTFTISPPVVTTRAPLVTNDLVTTVSLQGSVNPHGFPVNGFFEWGTNTAYGNTTASQTLGSGSVDLQFSQLLTALPRGDYHYRAVAVSPNETVRGSDQTFTITGPAGFAAKLSGTDYLRTTLWSDTMFTGEDITIELWFNANAPGELINEADTADITKWDYAFAEIVPGGILKVGMPGVPTITAGTITFGTWHHLAVVYDGTAKLLSAYIDGQPAGNSPGDRNTPKEIGRTSILTFGRGGQVNLGPGNWFNGMLDEIRIWRRPLSAADIGGSWNKILQGTDSSLYANWHLDSIISNQPYLSPDASGKNNNAWYVPQNVAMPLVASDAGAIPDRRPVVVSVSLRNASPSFIEFSGSVNPRGTNTQVYFEYGISNFAQRTATIDIGSSDTAAQFKAAVSDLVDNGVYQYRLVASNSFGVSISSTGTFTKTGWAGFAYHFNGVSSYIRTAVSQNVQFTNRSITIELWFYPTKTGVLASETTFTPTYDRSVIEILSSGSVQAGFNGITPITIGDALFNKWNHVALRYNEATQTMDGFINGVPSLQSRTGVRISPSDASVNGQFAFGRTASVKLGPGEYYGGDMDEIRVWNSARTDEDLTSARFNLLAGDEPNLVLNWRLGQVATDPILDNSVRGNNGQNFGASSIVSTAPLVYNIRTLGKTQIEAQFVVAPFAAYRLESTSDFFTWTSISTNSAPPNGYVRIPQSINTSDVTRFFRVMPQP